MINPSRIFFQLAWPRKPLALLFFFLACLPGCSTEQLNKIVEDVKTSTESVTKEVQKVIPVGSVKLSLDGPFESTSASVSLMQMGPNRESILQITTSDSSYSLPKVLFQGATKASSVQALQGMNVSGQLFVQTNEAAGIWQNDLKEKCVIRILSLQESELVGEIERTQMVSVDGKSAPVSGTFRAVIRNQ